MQHVCFALETEHGGERAEGFFARHFHAGMGVADNGGLEEQFACRVACATGNYFAAVGERVGQVFFHFGQRGLINQRAAFRAAFQAVAHFQVACRLSEFADKFVIHAALHIDAVGAHAGLPSVAEFAGNRAGDGGIEIGIVEHDKRCVAAQLHRGFFDGGSTLRLQLAADGGGAGKAEFFHRIAFGEHAADFARRASDHVEYARRNTGTFGQGGDGQCGKWRLRGWTDDEGAAGSQRGRGFARDHGVGEIPRSNRGAHADRLLEHHNTLVGCGAGDGVAVHAFGFFGIPFDVGRAVGNFAARLGQRLALLQCEQGGEFLLRLHHQIKPTAQDLAALFGRECAPGGQGGLGGSHRAFGFRRAHIGHAADGFAGGGVGYGDGAAAVGIEPLAVDVAPGAQEGVVF